MLSADQSLDKNRTIKLAIAALLVTGKGSGSHLSRRERLSWGRQEPIVFNEQLRIDGLCFTNKLPRLVNQRE